MKYQLYGEIEVHHFEDGQQYCLTCPQRGEDEGNLEFPNGISFLTHSRLIHIVHKKQVHQAKVICND